MEEGNFEEEMEKLGKEERVWALVIELSMNGVCCVN